MKSFNITVKVPSIQDIKNKVSAIVNPPKPSCHDLEGGYKLVCNLGKTIMVHPETRKANGINCHVETVQDIVLADNTPILIFRDKSDGKTAIQFI